MKVKETLKTVLLVLLMVCAVYLSYATWFFDDPGITERLKSALPFSSTANSYTISGGDFADAAIPSAISIKAGYGRYGAEYDSAALSAAFSTVSPYLVEALGSAKNGVTVTDAEWREALSGEGIFFDYRGTIPADTLSAFLSADIMHDHSASARFLMLSAKPDSLVFLYMTDGNSASVKRFETAVASADIMNAINGFSPNGAYFAFESNTENRLFCETLLIPKTNEFPVYHIETPSFFSETDTSETILRGFGFNPNTVESYTDRTGARVFVSGLETLQLGLNGELVYENPEGNSTVDDGLRPLEQALSLANQIYSALGCTTKPYICDFYAENGGSVALFGLSCDSIALSDGDSDYFVRAEFNENGVLVRFHLKAVTLVKTAETSSPLSDELALIAAADEHGALELRLPVDDSVSVARWTIISR